MKTCTGAVGSGHNLIIKDTTAKTAMTLTETILGPTIGTTNDHTGVIHNAHQPTNQLRKSHTNLHQSQGYHKVRHIQKGI